MGAAMLASCSKNTSTDAAAPNPIMDMARDAVLSKAKMREVLKDADAAKFDDVHAYKFTPTNGAPFYVFCGRINSKNSFGAYVGYEDFIATPLVLGLHENLPGAAFAEEHASFCDAQNDAGPFSAF